MEACSGNGGTVPLVLNFDTMWRRNNLIMGAEGGIDVACGPGLFLFHFIGVLVL
jgi:hypothetical protein